MVTVILLKVSHWHTPRPATVPYFIVTKPAPAPARGHTYTYNYEQQSDNRPWRNKIGQNCLRNIRPLKRSLVRSTTRTMEHRDGVVSLSALVGPEKCYKSVVSVYRYVINHCIGSLNGNRSMAKGDLWHNDVKIVSQFYSRTPCRLCRVSAVNTVGR